MTLAAELTEKLKQKARTLGFPLVGACPAVRPPGVERLDAWLAAGYAGEMHYLENRQNAYHDPEQVLVGARSLLMLGMPYRTVEPSHPLPGNARVSRYAWGAEDYHNVIRDRLHDLADELRRLAPEAKTRCAVDTAPILERDFARLAGIGWVGKNTMLISKPNEERLQGSYFFLAALLTDLELAYDQPYEANHCGTCTACLDACPTAAFPEPFVLDARRCISYLTIESREPTPIDLREGVGDWLFGCDICQEACPWNDRPTPPTADDAVAGVFAPLDEMNPVELASLFTLGDAEFRRRFRHTPLWRAHREGLLRNAAIILGNRPCAEALPALIQGLNDPHPMVRGAAAWALRQYNDPQADKALNGRREIETDESVLAELAAGR